MLRQDTKVSYLSEIPVPQTKSDKGRYIRVAAIDIMIRAGIWNICVAERALDSRKTSRIHCEYKRTRLNASDIGDRTQFDQCSSVIGWRGKGTTIQIQFKEYLRGRWW